MKTYKDFLLTLTFILNGFVVFPQNKDIVFDKLTIQDGLSQNSINSIFQDRDGFVWVGTEDGWNKFDGYTFKVFQPNYQDEYSIHNNYVYEAIQNGSGDYILGTEKGISFYDAKLERFYNPKILQKSSVRALLLDKGNNLWIGTFGKGLYIYNLDKFVKNRSKADYEHLQSLGTNIYEIIEDNTGKVFVCSNNGLFEFNPTGSKQETFKFKDGRKNEVYTILEEENGTLWIGTNNGLYKVNPQNEIEENILFSEDNSSPGRNAVKKLCEDNSGRIWVGTDDGLAIVDKENCKFDLFLNSINNPNSISQNIIQGICKDNNGAMWIGTESGGINIFNKKNRKFKTISPNTDTDNSLNNRVVYDFIEDKNHNIWIATYGGGLNKFDPKRRTFEIYDTKGKAGKFLPSDYIYSLELDKNGIIWIGTKDMGLIAFNPEKQSYKVYSHNPLDTSSISHNAVKSLFVTKDERIFVGTYGGGLNVFDPQKESFTRYIADGKKGSLKSNIIYSIFEDSEGSILVGTRGGGLNKYDQEKGTFLRYVNSEEDVKSLSNNLAFPIFEDSKKQLWVGTLGGGLNLFNRKTGKFRRFSMNDGLSSNVIYSIYEDNNQNIWFSSSNGINKFDIESFECTGFYESDGLQSNEFNGGSGFKASDGTMYFGGVKGFSYFHPDSIGSNHTEPKVFITNFKVLNKDEKPGEDNILKTSISKTKAIELQYYHNILTFEFTALNFTHPEMNQYACMMEGFEDDWNYLGNRRIVNYTNLDPGKYTFKVKGSNNDGIWCKIPAEISITVKPPFYKTKGFYAIVVIAILLSIYSFIKRRERKLKRDKEKLEKAVKDRTTEIRLQNKEILAQRDEIEAQRDEIGMQRDVIELKNQNITSSIQYAKKIQQAILPSFESFRQAFADFFVLYKPKDIVSGDYYWLERKGKDVILASVDCTGHGVPGAFMTFIASNLLNEAVNKKNITKPSEILNEINAQIQYLFESNNRKRKINDGMDISICKINRERKYLEFAGAINHLYICRDEELLKTEGDKFYIGLPFDEDFKSFTNHEIDIMVGDSIYLFSDGYTDQFGGKHKRKFTSKRFIDFLEEIHEKPFQQQKQILAETFENWKIGTDQTDDVLVIGVKI